MAVEWALMVRADSSCSSLDRSQCQRKRLLAKDRIDVQRWLGSRSALRKSGSF